MVDRRSKGMKRSVETRLRMRKARSKRQRKQLQPMKLRRILSVSRCGR